MPEKTSVFHYFKFKGIQTVWQAILTERFPEIPLYCHSKYLTRINMDMLLAQ